ncbi:MAG: hypothetical protein LBT09_11310 [Planctomycetaceae bacterium]|jgi:hypothetical protein|nr:hypothetical protein [Planctomycetaceae bacterium]
MRPVEINPKLFAHRATGVTVLRADCLFNTVLQIFIDKFWVSMEMILNSYDLFSANMSPKIGIDIWA